MATPDITSPHYTVTAIESGDAEDGRFYPFQNEIIGIAGLAMVLEMRPAADLPDDYFKFLGAKLNPPVDYQGLHSVRGDKAMYFEIATENTGPDAKERLDSVHKLIEIVMNVAENPAAYFAARYQVSPPVPDTGS